VKVSNEGFRHLVKYPACWTSYHWHPNTAFSAAHVPTQLLLLQCQTQSSSEFTCRRYPVIYTCAASSVSFVFSLFVLPHSAAGRGPACRMLPGATVARYWFRSVIEQGWLSAGWCRKGARCKGTKINGRNRMKIVRGVVQKKWNEMRRNVGRNGMPCRRGGNELVDGGGLHFLDDRGTRVTTALCIKMCRRFFNLALEKLSWSRCLILTYSMEQSPSWEANQ